MATRLERSGDDDRVRRLRKEIEDLNKANMNLKRENDRVCTRLFEAKDRILALESDASRLVADVPVVLDEPALRAAHERIAELEERLAQQVRVCREALAELAAAASEVEVARLAGEESALALDAALRERDQAVERAVAAEAALATLQRAAARPPLTTPLGPRAGGGGGHGLMTPDTAARPDAGLQTRYDALLAEKRALESRHAQLQHKWADFKELVQSRLSPQKPRAPRDRDRAPLRPSSPSPGSSSGGGGGFALPALPIPPSSSAEQRLPSSPTKAPAAKRVASALSHSRVSPEVVETSETEDEDWDGRPPPSRTVTPAHAHAPRNISTPIPSQVPMTPRRTVKRESPDETILVADSSPERATQTPQRPFFESQTQSQSSRAWSAPPESPVRPPSLKRKADRMSNDDDDEEQVTPRKVAKAASLDYSAFKGRGRYGATNPKPDERTVNAQFEVNREQNDGFSYEFDDVVRDKQKRKQLDGGDCECCRDYYEAIGPLPPRLQPPRWRSETPESQHLASRPCLRKLEGNSDAAAAIAAHKNEISRHRHQWAPAETPPDYWHIGFPTTQDVQDINRKAAEMHEQKKRHIAMEASKPNGKYKKKGR